MKTELSQLTKTRVESSRFNDYQTTDKPELVTGLIYSTTGVFTNIAMSDEFILAHLLELPRAEKKSGTVVIDYSSPNISKELHVGHLRSTLVGDCVANVLAKLGYDVIKQNHIGDKKFIEHIDKVESLEKIHEIYDILNVGLIPTDVKSESFFCGDTVLGLLPTVKIDDSIQIVVDGKFIVLKKSCGQDTYFLTDLAALYYRFHELNADKIIYVTDYRQQNHFAALFRVAIDENWASSDQLEHIATGCVLGKDKLPLKTRDGNGPLLKELIAHAIEFTASEAIGVGVLKYREYSVNKKTDYVFDLEKATSTKGNTSVYIQYTCARIISLLNCKTPKLIGLLHFRHKTELVLAKQILKWVDVLDSFDGGYKPSDITTYLYALAKSFNSFYEAEKILDAGNRRLKILLCEKCLVIFKEGLELLGIEILDKI